MLRFLLRSWVVCLVVCATGLPAEANAIRYTVTDIGTLPGGTSSFVYAINNAGQVVGSSYGTGFVYSNGQLTPLDRIGPINDSGEIPNIVLRDQNGANYIQSLDINNAGQTIDQSGRFGDYGKLRNPDGSVLVDFDRMGFAPRALNDAGQVAGYVSQGGRQVAALFDPTAGTGGELEVIGALFGFDGAAFDINSMGQVVGGGSMDGQAGGWRPDGSHAFFFDGERLLDLGTLYGGYSLARGINDNGQIVGRTSAPVTSALLTHAFLFEDGQMFDLNTLIDPILGAILEDAIGINNAGKIIANGQINGQMRGFLLTPVATPEPSTLLILGIGGGVFALALKKGRKGR